MSELPKPIINPDLSNIITECKKYFRELEDNKHDYIDSNKMFEIILKTFYGNEIFDWISCQKQKIKDYYTLDTNSRDRDGMKWEYSQNLGWMPYACFHSNEEIAMAEKRDKWISTKINKEKNDE